MDNKTFDVIDLSPLVNSRGEQEDFFLNNLMGVHEMEAIFDTILTPKLLNMGGACICIKGECTIVINTTTYHLTKGYMLIGFPKTVIKLVDKSADFESYIGGVEMSSFLTLFQPFTKSLYVFVRDNPLVLLTDKQISNIVTLGEILKEQYSDLDSSYRKEIISRLLEVMGYEIANIFQSNKTTLHKSSFGRSDMLFQEFAALLEDNFMISRELSFYANKLCVTPKHLSALVKEVSGYGANKLITSTVITNAKVMLSQTNMSVQQISDKLNFPNPSFFGQYFKRQTGMTPRKYQYHSENIVD